MLDRERAKTWIDEMSSNNLDRILYFMNLVLTKEELIAEKCNLQNEKQQLIKFLKEKIEDTRPNMVVNYFEDGRRKMQKINSSNIIMEPAHIIYQEVLDFVNKGGKE